MFANINIGKKLLLLSAVFIVGYVVFAVVSFSTLNNLRIGGKLYNQIVMSKDLIADVLPPPEYIIESYMNVLQMVDETDLAQINYFSVELKRLQADYEEQHQQWINEPHLEPGVLRDAMLKGAYEPAIQFYDIVFSKFIPALQNGNREYAKELVRGELKALYAIHRKSIDQVVLGATGKYKEAEILSDTTIQSDTELLFTIAFLIIVAAMILSLMIRHSIVKPIVKVTDTLKDISEGEGDLTRVIAINSKDEIGLLALYFNKTLEKIKNLIIAIKIHTESISSASEKLFSVSNQLASGAEETVSQSNTVAGTAEQMSVNVRSIASTAKGSATKISDVTNSVEQVAGNINAMASGAEQASVNASEVAGAAEQMSTNMNTIAAAIEEMSASINQISVNAGDASMVANEATVKSCEATEAMSNLGIAAKEIGHVTEVIKRIADKTNLLALNATIEAASAGVAGKGFAVVASEIKELANQSSQSADDIARRIQGIQNGTCAAVTVINNVSKIIVKINQSIESISNHVGQQTKASNEIANNVAQANIGTKRVAESMSEVVKDSNDIARNAGEAAKGVSEVSQNIANVSSVAKQSAQGATQINQSATNLSKIAGDLKNTVNRFKV